MAIIATMALLLLLTILFGSTLPRLPQVLIAALTLATIFGITLQSGLSPSPAARGYRRAFQVASFVSGIVLVGVVLLDHQFHQSDGRILGMEPATTLLVFGITFWPFSFVLMWTLGFDQAVIPPETTKQIDELARNTSNE